MEPITVVSTLLAIGPMLIQLVGVIFITLIAVIGSLIPLCVARAKNIPKHIDTLVRIFRDIDPSTKHKKVLALSLTLFSGIIPFITFSFIPFTGIPIFGIFTSSIGILVSFILICLTFELAIDPLLGEGVIKKKDIEADLKQMKEDYYAIKNKAGPHWVKLSKKFGNFLNANSQKINDIEEKLKITTKETCEKIEELITPSIDELKLYINNNKDITISKKELDVIQERIEAWKKVGISSAVGAGAGIGGAAAAKSVLVPATLWNSTINFFGYGGGGILVSSTTFALATTFLPISIGGAVFVGSMLAFKRREKKKLSRFLSDVVISAMPIVYADGNATEDEISRIKRLAFNSQIGDDDRKRILKALENPIDLDYVCSNFLMYEKKSEKAQIKARLLLSIAWELAKSDEKIHPKEVAMHDRMARIFDVEKEYTREVRLLLTPAYAALPK